MSRIHLMMAAMEAMDRGYRPVSRVPEPTRERFVNKNPVPKPIPKFKHRQQKRKRGKK